MTSSDTATPSTSRGQIPGWSRQQSVNGQASGNRDLETGALASREDAVSRLWTFAAIVVGLLVIAEAFYVVTVVAPAAHLTPLVDFEVFRANGATFLSTGEFYQPNQLAGPYFNELMHSVLYPPNALYLFVPLSLLPYPLAVLAWWGIPLAVTGYVLRTLQPAPWAWVVMLVLMLHPHSIGVFLFGNSDMWMLAGVAAGIRWGWPAVLLVLKPSLAVFALVGVRRRSWWIALAGLALASLPMLPMWFDYVTAMRNLQGGDIGYSLTSLPLLMVPLVGWLGGTRWASVIRGTTSMSNLRATHSAGASSPRSS